MIAQLKIKYKLILINLFSTLTVVLIVGGYWVYDGAKNYEDYFLKRISSQGQLVASNSAAAIIFEDWEEAKVILTALASDQAISSARIIKDDTVLMQVEYREPNQSEGFNLFSYFRQANHNGLLRLPVEGATNTFVELSYQDQELHAAIIKSICTVALMLAVAVVIALTLSILMQSYVTVPIQNFTSVAKKVISAKSYTKRGKFYYPEETSGLTKNFNEML